MLKSLSGGSGHVAGSKFVFDDTAGGSSFHRTNR